MSGEVAHVETKLRRQSSASIEWRNGETAAAPSSSSSGGGTRVYARQKRCCGLVGFKGRGGCYL